MYKRTFLINSVSGTRWYDLDASITKIDKVYFNDVMIPKLIGDPIIDDDEFTNPEDSSDTTLSTPTSNAENRRFWIFSNYDKGVSTAKTYRIGIVEKVINAVTRDGKTSNYQSISEVKELRMFAIARGADFTTDLTEISAIPVEFHDALIYKTLSDGYLKAGLKTGLDTLNPQASQIFDGKYKELIKDGKKRARNHYLGGATIIAPTDF